MNEPGENKHAIDLLKKKRWIDLSIMNLCIVALLGFTLRSKILFSMPFFDYNRLLDAHFHFAFGGWVTLVLVVLLIYDVLPEELHNRPVYQRLLTGIVLASWLLLLTSPLPPNNPLSGLFSTIFILVTYIFAWVFIKDMKKAAVSKTVFLLSVLSIASLVFSSVGVFSLAYLFAIKSLNTFAYRDALYTYLHFQYNGFFTLAVFAILFNKFDSKITANTQKNIYRFSILLCISLVLSLFLTYLWRDPNVYYRIIACCGSVSLMLCLLWFFISAISLKEVCKPLAPLIKGMGYLALTAFSLKTFLQCFTIFPPVGNAVFGDRPVIIGFLHLVFLGFISLMLLTYFAQTGLLNFKLKITRVALITFTTGVIINEAVLMTQGMGAMFIKSSFLFSWILWGVSFFLFGGALLIGVARFRTNQ